MWASLSYTSAPFLIMTLLVVFRQCLAFHIFVIRHFVLPAAFLLATTVQCVAVIKRSLAACQRRFCPNSSKSNNIALSLKITSSAGCLATYFLLLHFSLVRSVILLFLLLFLHSYSNWLYFSWKCKLNKAVV